MATTNLRELFAGWFDYYAARTIERLEGLTDAEYLWEPAPETSIVWGITHICSNLTEHELRPVAFEKGTAGRVAPSQGPATASEAIAALTEAVATWQHGLTLVSEERLWEPMGPEAGPFAEDLVASFVEHIHDEFIHHAAEIALLRDLYRSRLGFPNAEPA